jgi:hypothetical protein
MAMSEATTNVVDIIDISIEDIIIHPTGSSCPQSPADGLCGCSKASPQQQQASERTR